MKGIKHMKMFDGHEIGMVDNVKECF
jgi:hypothetical protein